MIRSKISVIALLLFAITSCSAQQDFEPNPNARPIAVATGLKPKMRSGSLLDLVGYATANDGYFAVVAYDPTSTRTIDNVFVFAPRAGQAGRLVATQRDILDLEYAGLSENADITTLLTNAMPNFNADGVKIRLPRSIKNLICGEVTFPADLERIEILAGACTITQAETETAVETMWLFPNPSSVRIERGVVFAGRIGATFTAPENGLIKIDGSTKSGIGGIIECHADFRDTSSTGLAIIGVTDRANAYQTIEITGEYEDSGVYAPSFAVDRDVQIDIHDATNYNTNQPASRRYTSQPALKTAGHPPLEAESSLSQGNYPARESARIHGGSDEFAEMLGTNTNAYINLPAGSVWQLTEPLIIRSGCTITTDPDNPATIVHPGDSSQGCLVFQGASIKVENVICDFAMGETWRTFRTFFAMSAGGFYAGPGASWNLSYDGERTGSFSTFFQFETLTFGNGATGKLATITDSGTTGTMVVIPLSGSRPSNNDTITGGTSARVADVNGTPTTAGSYPDRAMRDITINNVTFINSDDTRRNLPPNNDISFNYDGESAGPFVEGETLNFVGGDVGTLFKLTDNGTTGSMVVVRTTAGGTPAADDTLITGATSGATASVNGAVATQTHSGDGWCISFANNSDIYQQPVKNLKVTNCTMKARRFQLTANGSGLYGFDGVEISGNVIDYGYANAIAMSSLSDYGNFKNILIADNDIRNSSSASIYVGLDPDATGGMVDVVSVENLTIRNNRITNPSDSAGQGNSFPASILVRCTGNCKNLKIHGNTFNNLVGTGDYTFVDLRGAPVGPDNTYSIYDNEYYGNGDFEIGAEYVSVPQNQALMTGLVSYWPMDEASGSLIDAFERNDLPELNGTLGSVVDGPGGVNARRFPGTARALVNNSAWQGVPQTSFAFSVWVRVNDDADSGGLLAKYNTGGSYLLSYNATTDLITFSVRSSSNTFFTTNATTIVQGTWYHVAAWYDYPEGKIYLSINNGTPTSTAVTALVGSPAHDFQVGYDGTGGSGGFIEADICQLGFWKRALSSANRLALYNSGNGLPFADWPEE